MVYLTLGFVRLFQTKKEKTPIRKKKRTAHRKRQRNDKKGKVRKKKANKQKTVSGVFGVTVSTSLFLKCAIGTAIQGKGENRILPHLARPSAEEGGRGNLSLSFVS